MARLSKRALQDHYKKQTFALPVDVTYALLANHAKFMAACQSRSLAAGDGERPRKQHLGDSTQMPRVLEKAQPLPDLVLR